VDFLLADRRRLGLSKSKSRCMHDELRIPHGRSCSCSHELRVNCARPHACSSTAVPHDARNNRVGADSTAGRPARCFCLLRTMDPSARDTAGDASHARETRALSSSSGGAVVVVLFRSYHHIDEWPSVRACPRCLKNTYFLSFSAASSCN
jgi:hypothetical protein